MLNILVVEDTTRMAGLLKKGLSEEGYLVDISRDGEAGLAAARSGNYDLILLDINLPKMDGFELIRQLRESRSDVPVIMVTARDSVEDRSGTEPPSTDRFARTNPSHGFPWLFFDNARTQ